MPARREGRGCCAQACYFYRAFAFSILGLLVVTFYCLGKFSCSLWVIELFLWVFGWVG